EELTSNRNEESCHHNIVLVPEANGDEVLHDGGVKGELENWDPIFSSKDPLMEGLELVLVKRESFDHIVIVLTSFQLIEIHVNATIKLDINTSVTRYGMTYLLSSKDDVLGAAVAVLAADLQSDLPHVGLRDDR